MKISIKNEKRSITANVMLLQTVACKNERLSEFARTMQAQNNNNQSQMKLLIVVAVSGIPRKTRNYE